MAAKKRATSPPKAAATPKKVVKAPPKSISRKPASAKDRAKAAPSETRTAAKGAPVKAKREVSPRSGASNWSVPIGAIRGASPYAVREVGNVVWILAHTALVAADRENPARRAEIFPCEEGGARTFTRAHAVGDGRFYAVVEGDDGQEVWAVDPDGTCAWAATLPEDAWGPELLASGGRLLVQRGAGIVALDARSGTRLWASTLAGPDARACAALASEGLLVVVADDVERLVLLDSATGEVRSTTPCPDAWQIADAGGGKVLLGGDGGLHLVDIAREGPPLWTDPRATPPFALDGRGHVLVHRDVRKESARQHRATLSAIDLRTGASVWETRVDLFSRMPIVVGDRVFLQGNRELVALSLVDGALTPECPAHAALGGGRDRLYAWTGPVGHAAVTTIS